MCSDMATPRSPAHLQTDPRNNQHPRAPAIPPAPPPQGRGGTGDSQCDFQLYISNIGMYSDEMRRCTATWKNNPAERGLKSSSSIFRCTIALGEVSLPSIAAVAVRVSTALVIHCCTIGILNLVVLDLRLLLGT